MWIRDGCRQSASDYYRDRLSFHVSLTLISIYLFQTDIN